MVDVVRGKSELTSPALTTRPLSPPGCTADGSFSRCVRPAVCTLPEVASDLVQGCGFDYTCLLCTVKGGLCC